MKENSVFSKFIKRVKVFLSQEDSYPNWFILFYFFILLAALFKGLECDDKNYEYERIIKEDYGILFDNYEEYKSLKSTLKID